MPARHRVLVIAQLTPLVREPGILVITDKNMYFQPLHNLAESSPARCRPLGAVGAVAPRRVCHRPRALEAYFLTAAPGEAFGASALFEFGSAGDAAAALAALAERAAAGALAKDSPLGSRAAAAVFDPAGGDQWLTRTVAAWRAGAISNFDFLSYLNLVACVGVGPHVARNLHERPRDRQKAAQEDH